MPKSPLTSPDIWNDLSAAYDKTIVPLFSLAAERGIELVDPAPSDEVLDVACGPGTLTLRVAARVRRVVALDFAQSMVDLLKEKCKAASLTNVEPLVGDAMELPFAECRFDAAFSCFGLFLFADRAMGFSELRRVVKPKGKIMISSWAPAEGPIEDMYRIVREVLPDLPFQKGAAPLGTKQEIIEEMSRAGLDAIQIESIRIPFDFASADDFWQENGRASAPLVATRRRVPTEDWPAVESRILGSLRSSFPTQVRFDRFAWIAVGRKPSPA